MRLIARYKDMTVQGKAALWFIACSVLQKGIGFITVPIFARLMTPHAYGDYTVYLSWLHILSIFTSLNLYYGVLDNGLSRFDRDRDRYVSSMQGLTMALTTLFLVFYLLFYPLLKNLIRLAPGMIALMFIEMYVAPAILFYTGRHRFEYSYKLPVLFTLIKAILSPAFGILMVLLFPDSGTGRVAGLVLVEILVSGGLMIHQFARGRAFYDKKYWRYGLSLGLPLLPHYLSGTILSQGDRIMIENLVNSAAVAVYSISYSVGMVITIFGSALSGAMTPWIYRRLKSGNARGVSGVISGMVVIIAAMTLMLMLAGPEVILVFGSERYIAGQYVIPPVAGGVFFIFLYEVFAIPQFYYEKTGFLMFASLLAAALNIVLNFIFIPMYGFVGAGYTTLVCYILYSTGHFIVGSRLASRNLEGQRLFDGRFVTLAAGVVVFASIFANYLIPYRILRFTLLAALAAGLLIKHRQILGLFRSLRETETLEES